MWRWNKTLWYWHVSVRSELRTFGFQLCHVSWGVNVPALPRAQQRTLWVCFPSKSGANCWSRAQVRNWESYDQTQKFVPRPTWPNLKSCVGIFFCVVLVRIVFAQTNPRVCKVMVFCHGVAIGDLSTFSICFSVLKCSFSEAKSILILGMVQRVLWGHPDRILVILPLWKWYRPGWIGLNCFSRWARDSNRKNI